MSQPQLWQSFSRGFPLAVLAALFFAVVLVAPVAAQAPGDETQAEVTAAPETGAPETAAPEAATPASAAERERLETLLQTLRDDTERERFLNQLEGLLAAEGGALPGPLPSEPAEPRGLGGQLLSAVSQQVDTVGTQVGEAVDALASLPGALADLAGDASDPETRNRWIEIGLKLALILGLAWLAEWLSVRALAKARAKLEVRGGETLVMRAVYLAIRALIDLVPIAIFAAVAYAVLPMTDPRPATQLVALTIINANILARIVMVLARAVFAPRAAGLRFLPMGDETANYATLWVRRISFVAIYGYFIAEAALLLGLAEGAYSLFLKLIGLAVAAMVIMLILQNRAEISQVIRGQDRAKEGGVVRFRALRARVAEIWHILLIVYVLAVYVVWAMEVEGGFEFLIRATFLSVLLLAIFWVVHAALDRAFARGFHVNHELRAKYPNLELRANRYVPGLRRVVSIVLGVFVFLMLLQIWGFGTVAILTSDAGRELLARLVKIFMMVGFALLAWEIVSVWIEKTLTERAGEGGPRSQRMQTLLPLLRNVVRVVLVVMVTLIVLSELGVDIGPLLAGAGVIGLAIGFGAQTLVRDIITGAFILVEDTIAVGDWVDLGGNSGAVEAMTIRTVTLRDTHGHLHTIPFGEVSRVLNMNRDYGNAVIDIGVAYREDTDEVIKLLQQVADELKADPDWGERILGDLEVFGVNDLSDSSVDLRVRLRCKPMTHFGVRREFLRRAKKLFDLSGVEIPFPHQTIYFGVDKDGKAPPARLVLDAEEAEETGEAGESAAPKRLAKPRRLQKKKGEKDLPDADAPDTDEGDAR